MVDDSQGVQRPVPLQSVRRRDDDRTTATLRLLFYLQEVERQAELFNLAFDEAMETALQRTDDLQTSQDLQFTTWRNLQSAMFAAIIVNRLVSREQNPRRWPGRNSETARREAREAAKWRARELRRLLALPERDEDTPIFTLKTLRDSFEHVDERLDMALHSGVLSISDWYISDGSLLVSAEEVGAQHSKAGLRAFFPEGGLLWFDRERLDLFQLDIDMRRLRHNAREAMAELLDTLSGRMSFGGHGQVSHVAPQLRDRVSDWRQQAQAVEDSMAPSPRRLDGYVRLWGRVSALVHGDVAGAKAGSRQETDREAATPSPIDDAARTAPDN